MCRNGVHLNAFARDFVESTGPQRAGFSLKWMQLCKLDFCCRKNHTRFDAANRSGTFSARTPVKIAELGGKNMFLRREQASRKGQIPKQNKLRQEEAHH